MVFRAAPGVRLFENYLIVDWSAASVPRTGPDSICHYMLRRQRRAVAANPATRMQAEFEIGESLEHARGATLCGFDFPLGYPAGFGPWRAVWNEIELRIEDGADNSNNRFAAAADWNRHLGPGPGPFWGCPRGSCFEHLEPRRPESSKLGLAEKRICELRVPRTQPVWKLYGAGSVGSQALTGIPCVARLRARFPASRVWPFETGLRCPRKPGIVFAEVYPSMIEGSPRPGEFKDQTQVRSLARYFAELDGAGELASLFEGGTDLTRRERSSVVRDEGWVLGVT